MMTASGAGVGGVEVGMASSFGNNRPSAGMNDPARPFLSGNAAAAVDDPLQDEVEDPENNSSIMAMSTSALESKLESLREQSNQHSQALTQKLATSQSGQNLLHIGSSLSTLPPDLHALLTSLHPVLSAAESTDISNLKQLQTIVNVGNAIRVEKRRIENALDCADRYQDLLVSESTIKKSSNTPHTAYGSSSSSRSSSTTTTTTITTASNTTTPTLVEEVCSLERSAHAALCLIQDLESSTTKISSSYTMTAAGNTHAAAGSTDTNTTNLAEGGTLPSMRVALEDDTEQAQFLMKLSPRIRRLESNTHLKLMRRLEDALKKLKHDVEMNNEPQKKEDLLVIEHCIRGLMMLGKGKDVESLFARVAIMPLIRSNLSMGRLDQGGARGECAGLLTLLQDTARSVSQTYGSVLSSAEFLTSMEAASGNGDNTDINETEIVDIDLVTAGVWVPIATALMADPAIKMAIFSPGIASVLQANYTSFDAFLADLANSILKEQQRQQQENKTLSLTNEEEKVAVHSEEDTSATSSGLDHLYFEPSISSAQIKQIQNRIYCHPTTSDFSKKWSLPIYYQLRYGECCNRLNMAIERVKMEGWSAQVFTGTTKTNGDGAGFELEFFQELYDILLLLWKPDFILRPLTHRFLRGAVQLICRTLAFVSDCVDEGQQKKNKGGGSVGTMNTNGHPTTAAAAAADLSTTNHSLLSSNISDVATVAWDLHVLERIMSDDYPHRVILPAVGNSETNTSSENEDLQQIITGVLAESSEQIPPILHRLWHEVIVNILTAKCSGPLSAVKGVAATYRMTNRPPPTHASPFVATILKPLKEFDSEFSNKTPPQIGARWKLAVVTTVSQGYSAAVEELITTVQRTEVALKNRKARRTAAGVVSDGEKVKRQLFLDYREFSQMVHDLNIDVNAVAGLMKFKMLTADAACHYSPN